MKLKEIFQGIGISISEDNHSFPFSADGVLERLDFQAYSPQYLTKYMPPERYDYVYSGRFLQHVSLPKACVLEWWGVVRDGGYLVLLVPNEDRLPVRDRGARCSDAWSFAIWKERSWNPRSINVAEILAYLPRSEIVGIEEHGTDILAVARKLPAEAVSQRVFRHSGARGDIIYSLPTIKALGGGTLALDVRNDNHYLSAPMTYDEIAAWKEMLEGEDYISEVRVHDGACDVDLDQFRDMDVSNNFLFRCPLTRFACNYDLTKPWISRERIGPESVAEVIVSRSPRYHGPFRWQELAGWESRCAFIGSEQEHIEFEKQTGLKIRLHSTKTVLDVARAIAGAKLFVGNQSFPYSLAEAMKVPRVLEVCLYAPNCNPQGADGHIRLTQAVLRRHLDGEDIDTSQCTKSHHFAAAIRQKPAKLSKGLCRAVPVQGRPLVSFIFMDGPLTDTIENYWFGVVSNERVVLSGDATFFEMANAGAKAAKGDVLCVIGKEADPADAYRLFSKFSAPKVGIGSRFMDCWGVGKVPFLSGDVLLVSREAYEDAGLFNESVTDGGKWLEMSVRYAKFGWGLASLEARSIGVTPSELDKRMLRDAYGVLP